MDGGQHLAVDGQATRPMPSGLPWFDFGPYEGGVGFLHRLRHELPEDLDHSVHAMVAKATGGISPVSMAGSFLDWAVHLWFSPGQQWKIALKAADKSRRFGSYVRSILDRDLVTGESCIEPLAQDRRFEHESWQTFPFNLIHQQFLLTQQWWHNVFTGVPGVRPQHEALADFTARQFLDVVSPSNFFFTNPEVLQRTFEEKGANLWRGGMFFVDDLWREISGRRPAGHEAFNVGRNLAVTEGKVVFRNHLIELIQYTPTTPEVHKAPVLVLPAWIMKYYILDLSPENSLVRYLVDQGYTVFMVSWRNPDEHDRHLGLSDYLELGAFAAIEAVRAATGEDRLHLAGYCLGGTLAAMAASALARTEDNPLLTLTMLAAQVDFLEAGELSLFISDSQLTFLDDLMWEQGYLGERQMGGAFRILRSNDLIWSRNQRQYWLGERRPPNDLIAWNADGTRMPARMHSEYLRKLYLNNDLAEGRFEVRGAPVSVSDIRVPIFAVSTTRDHVAPWKSVYKLHALCDTEVTFVLTTGGHNAGIVSEPGHPRRSFDIATTGRDAHYRSPEQWQRDARHVDGSWWPRWQEWLAGKSGGDSPPRTPRRIDHPGNRLDAVIDAPGTYVLQT